MALRLNALGILLPEGAQSEVAIDAKLFAGKGTKEKAFQESGKTWNKNGKNTQKKERFEKWFEKYMRHEIGNWL